MPMVLGHEAAGEVLAIGADVRDFAVGDQVVFAFVPACGHCAYCTEGRAALCEPGARANTAGTLLSGARRWHGDASELHHHLGVSAFAEATVVSARSAVRIEAGRDGAPLDWTIAALFGCAVLTGVGAVVNRSEEHTSELQSLMRISYAVFCLKKKTYKQTYKLQSTKQHSSDYFINNKH